MSDTAASSEDLAAALDASDGFQILARALPDAVLVVRPNGTPTPACSRRTSSADRQARS